MLKKTLWILAVIGLAYAGGRMLPGSGAAAHAYFSGQAFEVIAHGGGRGLAPDNTLEAARESVRAGADVLEMDVHASRDGVLVLSHDASVDAMTDGSGLIRDMTFDQLQQLDAAAGFRGRDGQTLQQTGIRLPALKTVFEALPDARYVIEIKQQQPSIVQPLCTLLRQQQLQARVLVGSFHDDVLKAFRQDCPEVATSFSRREVTALVVLHKVGLEHLYPLQGVALQVPPASAGIRILTPAFVQAMQARGLKVQVWTINQPEAMHELLGMGVDGIITDYPDLLRAVLDKPRT
jgi:glycerophosphoryl diester phosphodiesterase